MLNRSSRLLTAALVVIALSPALPAGTVIAQIHCSAAPGPDRVGATDDQDQVDQARDIGRTPDVPPGTRT